ncbi:DUF6334 family protein [Anaerolineales bacterium HSG6]|nr:DUF6334 family protein [Anaerolineales bacterium HSG6]
MVVSDEFPISYNLTGISVVENKIFGGKNLLLEEVNLFFAEVNKVIKLRPLGDTDEIEITQQTVTNVSTGAPYWGETFIGKQLQAIWVCDNNQGYQDMVIFGFDWLRPSLTFISEVSMLVVMGHNETVKRTGLPQ